MHGVRLVRGAGGGVATLRRQTREAADGPRANLARMDNHARILQIQQLTAKAERLKQEKYNACWSCKWRESGYDPDRNADCNHPVRKAATGNSILERFCRDVRKEDGLCGPTALLYQKPTGWQWTRWLSYCRGHRPDYLGGKDVRPEPM